MPFRRLDLAPGRHRRPIRLLAAALLVAASGASCHGQVRPAGRDIDMTLRDFRIIASAATVRAGTFTFVIHARGPTTHEFNVVRTDVGPAALPLRRDGITVDEDSPLLHWAGSRENLDIGDVTSLTVPLRPGHYVVFCNMEGHYLAGMHLPLTVR